MSEDITTLVIDSGSCMVKAGFAGDHAPRAVIPTIVRNLRNISCMINRSHQNQYVGDTVFKDLGYSSEFYSYKYPMEHGMIKDWTHMERVWSYTFYDGLRVAPEEYGLLLTEQLFNSMADREKTTQIMFESFNIRFFHPCIGPVLSLYASGRTTGVVVESGGGVSHVVPIFKQHAISHAIQREEVASGRDLTDYLVKMLAARGYSFTTTTEREVVADIKEKLCYVSLDFNQELQANQSIDRNYELPDGQVITVSDERFRCAEPIFQPALLGMSAYGLQHRTNSSIMRCDASIRHHLYNNIILSGGSSLFPNFADRFKRELTSLASSGTGINVISPDRRHSAWVGGSVLASMTDFIDICITCYEYDECGPSILQRKHMK